MSISTFGGSTSFTNTYQTEDLLSEDIDFNEGPIDIIKQNQKHVSDRKTKAIKVEHGLPSQTYTMIQKNDTIKTVIKENDLTSEEFNLQISNRNNQDLITSTPVNRKENQSNETEFIGKDLIMNDNNYKSLVKYQNPQKNKALEDITNAMIVSRHETKEIQSNETVLDRQDLIMESKYNEASYLESLNNKALKDTKKDILISIPITKETQSNETVFDRQDLIMSDKNHEEKHSKYNANKAFEEITETKEIQFNETVFNRKDFIMENKYSEANHRKSHENKEVKKSKNAHSISQIEGFTKDVSTPRFEIKEIQSNETVVNRQDLILDTDDSLISIPITKETQSNETVFNRKGLIMESKYNEANNRKSLKNIARKDTKNDSLISIPITKETQSNETVFNRQDLIMSDKNHEGKHSKYNANKAFEEITETKEIQSNETVFNRKDLIMENKYSEANHRKSHGNKEGKKSKNAQSISQIEGFAKDVSKSKFEIKEIQSNETVVNRQDLILDDDDNEAYHLIPHSISQFADLNKEMSASRLDLKEIKSNETVYNRKDLILDGDDEYEANQFIPHSISQFEDFTKEMSTSRLDMKEIKSNETVVNRQDLILGDDDYGAYHLIPHSISQFADLTKEMSTSRLDMKEIKSNETVYNRKDLILDGDDEYETNQLIPHSISQFENFTNTPSRLEIQEIQSNESVFNRQDLILEVDEDYETNHFIPRTISEFENMNNVMTIPRLALKEIHPKETVFNRQDSIMNETLRPKPFVRLRHEGSTSNLALDQKFFKMQLTSEKPDYELKSHKKKARKPHTCYRPISKTKTLHRELNSNQSVFHRNDLVSKVNDENSDGDNDENTDSLKLAGDNHISPTVSIRDTGEPLVSQKVQIDFSPIRGIDDNKVIMEKCIKFWEFIAQNPEIQSLKVMPEKSKVNEESQEDDYSKLLNELEESKISTPESTLTVNWLTKDNITNAAYATKMPKTYCEAHSRFYDHGKPKPQEDLTVRKPYVQKSHGALPSTSKGRNSQLLTRQQKISEITKLMTEMHKFDVEHPKSMEPPKLPVIACTKYEKFHNEI